MSPQPGSSSARRTPRLGRVAGQPLFTLAQKARREALERQLRALVRTPKGALELLREYTRVAPEAAALALEDFYDWLRRTRPATVADHTLALVVHKVAGE